MNYKLCNKKYFIFNQPLSFYIIFLVELWERFSYYGLQSILVIYLVKNLNLSEYNAISIFSTFIAILYGFIFIGGWIGDKILGLKRTIIIGLLVLLIGYIIISISNNNISLVYLGMSFIAVGNGLFKANPTSLITNIYKKNKDSLDSAFTIFYMSINIGSFISMIIVPLISFKYNWNIAFLFSVIGSLISIFTFIYFYKHFNEFGSEPDFKKICIKDVLKVFLLTSFLILSSYILLKKNNLTKLTLIIIFLFLIIKLFKETIYSSKIERAFLIISYIMIFESILFFILYSQMPTTLNFFAIHHVNNKMFGINFRPEQFQALNPMWIIILSPILAAYYNSIGRNLQITYKFAFGMLLCAFSFLILSFGIIFHDINGNISSYWLLISYLLQGIGELIISGLGLSMLAKFVPFRLMGFMTGFWFLINSSSAILSGYLANIISVNKNNILNKIESLYIYNDFFFNIGIFSIFISIVMFYVAYKIEKFIFNNNYLYKKNE